MRRASWKSGLMVMMLGGMLVLGCSGDVDILDEIGHSYYIDSIEVQDRGVSTTDIDIIEDCPTGQDPITKASMNITMGSDEDTSQDIWLYRIRIEYSLLDWTGLAFNEPSIPPRTYDRTAKIGAGGSSRTESFDLLTTEQKAAYRELLGGDEVFRVATHPRATFQVKVIAFMTFTPESPENHREPASFFTINVQNFLDSSCGDVVEDEE